MILLQILNQSQIKMALFSLLLLLNVFKLRNNINNLSISLTPHPTPTITHIFFVSTNGVFNIQIFLDFTFKRDHMVFFFSSVTYLT